MYVTTVSVSSHCVLDSLRNATVTEKKKRSVPNGINKSIKIWLKMLLTGYLGMVMWFCLTRSDDLNVDGTIFDKDYS